MPSARHVGRALLPVLERIPGNKSTCWRFLLVMVASNLLAPYGKKGGRHTECACYFGRRAKVPVLQLPNFIAANNRSPAIEFYLRQTVLALEFLGDISADARDGDADLKSPIVVVLKTDFDS